MHTCGTTGITHTDSTIRVEAATLPTSTARQPSTAGIMKQFVEYTRTRTPLLLLHSRLGFAQSSVIADSDVVCLLRLYSAFHCCRLTFSNPDSVISGALACLASVLGKVAFDGDTAFHLMATTYCDDHLPLWVPCNMVSSQCTTV